MSVSLSQDNAAGFTDRPDDGGTGLLVELSTGTDGEYLEHDCSVNIPRMNVRVMFNYRTADGGVVSIIRGISDTDDETFRVDYDASLKQISLALVSGDVLSYTLSSQLPWQCIECEIDSDAGDAALYINAVRVGQITGVTEQLTTRKVWLGGFFKQPDVVGQYYLDEWIIAEKYIGPVIVPPASEYGDDARRWLVMYNLDDTDSISWANEYRQARDIPYANLLGMSAGSNETINESTFNTLIAAINDYLTNNGLANNVIGILLGHGMPGYVLISGQVEPLGALLSVGSVAGRGMTNPIGTGEYLTRPTSANLGVSRLTARIDGATLTASQTMIYRADSLTANGLGDAMRAGIWLQPYTSPDEFKQIAIDEMANWASSIERMKTRLPIELSYETDPGQEMAFSTITDDGFFWGWASQLPGNGFFNAPAGLRIFCYPIDDVNATASTIRSGNDSNWIEKAISEGYASATGSSRGCDVQAILSVQIFFEALRSGWSLGEAWFVAQPRLGESLFLVGDPLMQISLPKAGWDVFGPVKGLDQVDFQSPMAALRDNERLLTLYTAIQPAEGYSGLYLVRRSDTSGRMEGTTRCIAIAKQNGQAAKIPLAPACPCKDNWPVRIENEEVQLEIAWEKTLADCNVANIELDGEIDGGDAQTLETIAADMRSQSICTTQPLPNVSARYRWRILSKTGTSITTPWSVVVRPMNHVLSSLKSAEGNL